MGKTESGAIWLDPTRTSPYEYYQYWVNLDDADVAKCLRLFTYLSQEQIQELEQLEGADIRKAKAVLAFETTSLAHGEEEARKAEKSSRERNWPAHVLGRHAPYDIHGQSSHRGLEQQSR